MRALLLVVSLSTVVLARPDIGLELRHKPLATSYGVPSASITNLGAHNFLPPSPTFETPSVSTIVPFYSGPVSTPAPIFAPTVSSTPAPFYAGAVSTTAAPLFNAPDLTNNLVSSSYPGGLIYNPGPAYFGGLPSLPSSQYIAEPVQEQKHVYFYEAPEEPEEIVPQVNYQTSNKKNVKIIFIKAPQYSAPVYPAIPPPPQNPEKTIVYVLVKKPDPQEQIVVPTVPPTAPAKPEVYFIKYKNQQEAEEKVSNTLNEHSSSGANIITSGIGPAHLSGGVIGNPLIGGPIISSTESPLGLINGGFIGTSTLAPIIDNSYLLGGGVALSGGGIPGQYYSSTEPTILSSSPYSFAPVHPTYGPPKEKK